MLRIMTARCTFCGGALPFAPPGVSIACTGCGNLTTTTSAPLPNASVSGPKQAASPPPAIVMPSRAGGVDELIGGGITLFGIGLAKIVILGVLGLGFSCVLGMLGLLVSR